MKKNIFVFTVFIMITAFVYFGFENTQAKVQISKKSIKMDVSTKHVIKLKGYNGKVNWKSSKPKVAKVNQKGIVTALKEGKATITAKIKKNRYKCVIIVKDKKKVNRFATNLPDISSEKNATKLTSGESVSTPTPVPTKQPKLVPEPTPTQEPEPVPEPMPTPTEEPLYPALQIEDVFWGCYVSDIGENYIEVSDENGGLIWSFNDVDSGIKVFYDAVITPNAMQYVDIEGDTMEYSDIHIGDKVDIIYNYWCGDLLAEKKSLSYINVCKK